MNHFKNAAVVGAGTMGHGIAYLLAQSGIHVCLIDQARASLHKAMDNIDSILEASVLKERMSDLDARNIRSRIQISEDLESLSGCDLMIEAIHENSEAKRHIFVFADAIMDENALLASNTSSLSIAQIAESLVHKERMIGLHFFNPPHIMLLLEIIVHEHNSLESIEAAKALAQLLGKEAIIVNDSPGFATSRLGISFALEAMRMLEQGVAGVSDLDSAMKLGYGHPMGPLMLSDWVGLDVRLAISEHLYRSLDSAVFNPPDILRRMVRAGFLGKKSGSGFYDWDKGRSLGVSHAIAELIQHL